MNTAKIYYNTDGEERTIHQMVREEPQWAANRIQVGEQAIEKLEGLGLGPASSAGLSVAGGQGEVGIASFGRKVWEYVKEYVDSCEIDTEKIFDFAVEAGLCEKVEYDPEKHENIYDADPGDEIVWWGGKKQDA